MNRQLTIHGAAAAGALLSLVFTGAACTPDQTEEQTVTGYLQRVVADQPEQGRSQLMYLLQQADGSETELRFAEPPDLPTGSWLRVWGPRWGPADRAGWEAHLGTTAPLRVAGFQLGKDQDKDQDNANANAGQETAVRQALVLDPTRAPPPRKLAVVLLNFQNDNRQPMTAAEARRRIFQASDSTRAFYKEQSYGVVDLVGKTSVEGEVFGWYTIPMVNRPCNVGMWGEAALAAARSAGVDTAGYDHYVFFFPDTPACPYLGLGQQPGRNTWINGTSIATFNHELGHNIGTPHAGARACTGPDGQRVTLNSVCRDAEYGNPFDVMGAEFRHTHAYNKAQARWLTGGNLLEVVKDGVYTLLPQERPSTGLQLLSIARDELDYFHIEYRQPMGLDRFPPESPAVNGVIIVLGGNVRRFSKSFLLDMTPQTTTFADAPLPVGQTFLDDKTGIRITLLDRTAEGARVEVKFTKPAAGGITDAGSIPPWAVDGGAAADAGVRPDAYTPVIVEPGPRPAPTQLPPPPAGDSGCRYGGATDGGGRASSLGWALAVAAGLLIRMARRTRWRRRWRALQLPVVSLLLPLLLGLSQWACSEKEPQLPPLIVVDARTQETGTAPTPPDSGVDIPAPGAPADAGDAPAADRPPLDGGTADGLNETDGPPPAQIVLWDVPAPVAMACLRYAEVGCARLQTCLPDRLTVDHGTLEICQARRQQSCRAEFLYPGRGELPRDRNLCSDALGTQSCRDLILGRPLAACDPPPGTLALGAACFSQSQCGRGLRCKIDADVCGTCQPAIPVGADCGWWAGGCPLGTRCYDDLCLAQRRLGESCKTSPAPCEPGLTCGAQQCVQRNALAGASCAAGEFCDPEKNLFCNLTTGLCQALAAPSAPGQPCQSFDKDGAPLYCGGDSTCFNPSGSVTGARSCVAKAVAGQPCDPIEGKLCLAPATCARGTCVMPTIISGGSYKPPMCR